MSDAMAEFAQRNMPTDVAFSVPRQFRRHVRLDEPRRDGVHRHTTARKLGADDCVNPISPPCAA